MLSGGLSHFQLWDWRTILQSTDQISLFGKSEPPARRIADRAPLAAADDPISSHLAAAELTSSGRRASQKAEIVAWLREQVRPLTSMEIAHAAGLDRYMVARRLPDLERDGMVERCAMRECSPLPPSGAVMAVLPARLSSGEPRCFTDQPQQARSDQE